MITLFNDRNYFIVPCIKAFEKLELNCNSSFFYFVELLQKFIEEGSVEAKRALEKKYEQLFLFLLKKRRVFSNSFARDNFEKLCITLSKIDKTDKAIEIINDLGLLFIANPRYSVNDFDLFLESLNACNFKAEIESKITNSKLEGVESFVQSYLSSIKPTKNTPTLIKNTVDFQSLLAELEEKKELSIASKVRFSRTATEDEKTALAVQIVNEPNLDKKQQLLSVFTLPKETFPLDHEILISYYFSANENLSQTALNALTHCKSPEVRELGFKLLSNQEHTINALSIILENFSKDDKDLLLFELKKLKITFNNQSNWHEIHTKILHVFKKNSNLPKEFLLYVYNTTLCPFCRAQAVEELSKRRLLPKEIIEECRFDCNEDICNFINQAYPL